MGTDIIEELQARGHDNIQGSTHSTYVDAYEIGRALSQLQD